MTKYVTVKLTEDQAKELHFQLEMMLAKTKSERAYGFLMRITNKLADQLNEAEIN